MTVVGPCLYKQRAAGSYLASPALVTVVNSLALPTCQLIGIFSLHLHPVLVNAFLVKHEVARGCVDQERSDAQTSASGALVRRSSLVCAVQEKQEPAREHVGGGHNDAQTSVNGERAAFPAKVNAPQVSLKVEAVNVVESNRVYAMQIADGVAGALVLGKVAAPLETQKLVAALVAMACSVAPIPVHGVPVMQLKRGPALLAKRKQELVAIVGHNHVDVGQTANGKIGAPVRVREYVQQVKHALVLAPVAQGHKAARHHVLGDLALLHKTHRVSQALAHHQPPSTV